VSEGERGRGAVDWKTIERVADQAERDEMKDLLEASDEELDAELGEAGFAAGDAAKVLEAALAKAGAGGGAQPAQPAKQAPEPPAKVVSLAAEREKRRRPVAWVTLVAAAAAVAVLVGGGAAVVALREPAPVPRPSAPTQSVTAEPEGLSPEVLAQRQQSRQHLAEALRDQAAAWCGAEEWAKCQASLAQASQLDPAGDGARAVQRLRGKASRGLTTEMMESKPGLVVPRGLTKEGAAALAEKIAPMAGQSAQLACARTGEAGHLCDLLAAAMRKDGWTVTRAPLVEAADAGKLHGLRVTVATDAPDAVQAAADALADGLEGAYLATTGPDDAEPGADVPLRVMVGAQ
jgi:hypothetical protein